MSQDNTAQANSNFASNTNETAANDEGGWNELRSAIQGRWSELKNEDLDRLKGRVNRLVTLVKDKYAITAEDARRQVSEFEQTLEDKASQVYKSASDSVSNRYRVAREGVNEFAQDVRTYGFGTTAVNLARDYPITAVSTAFVLGALVAGSTVRSRRRRWY
jgi:hypothetical protein